MLPIGSSSAGETALFRLVVTLQNPAGLQTFGLALSFPQQEWKLLCVRLLALTTDWQLLDGVQSAEGMFMVGGFHLQLLAAAQPGELLEILLAGKQQLGTGLQVVVHQGVDDFANAQSEMEAEAGEPASAVPVTFQLEQSFPNPLHLSSATARTVIRFAIPGTEMLRVDLSIFNIAGQRVRHLISENWLPGFCLNFASCFASSCPRIHSQAKS